MMNVAQPAKASGEFLIAGELQVTRLGFGSMRLTEPGIRGSPSDPSEARRVLRRAVDLGVNFIDTADSYRPMIAEGLIKEALFPYPDDLVIATKAGLARCGPGGWQPLGRPECLRQQAESSLRRLGLEQIKLLHLHRIDPQVPIADQLGELRLLQQEGKIRYIGLSEVDIDQVEQARKVAAIASVQEMYNLANRSAEALVRYAERHDIAFFPRSPLAAGALAAATSPLAELGTGQGATAAQLALAWLLRRSPVILPIPATSKVTHVEANIIAAELRLSEELYLEIGAVPS